MARRAGVRWWEPAPEALVAAGLTAFLVQETEAATSALRSRTALALMAGTAVAWLAGRAALVRLVRRPLARTAPFAVAAAAVLGAVVAPAYRHTTVVETLPRPAPALGAAGSAQPGLSAPARLRSARFRGVDHRAEGTVALYRRADGGYTIGLEEIDIQPGPNYDLYLVPGAGREDREGGVRVDDLRGNRGTQFYDVPSGVDVTSGPWTVLVWCQTFGVPIATATPV